MADKVLSMLGLARRAGQVQIGAFLTERAVQDGICELIVLASDAADNNKKKFLNAASYYKVPLIVYGTKETLAQALGKDNAVAAAVTDKNFARGIIDKIESMQNINLPDTR